jgi:hypothetical protein
MKSSKSQKRASQGGIDSTLIQLYGKVEVTSAPLLKREEWPRDPKGRVDRITEGFRKKGFKWRTYPIYDTDAPMENDPDKLLRAIRFFLWYCKECRFYVRMALRRFFYGIRTLAILCRRRGEKRRRMLLDMVDRWTKLQQAAWKKIEDAMTSPTYTIRHSTTETMKMKEMLHVSEAEMYAVVRAMYYDQRSRYRTVFSAWYEAFEPVAAEMQRLKEARDLKGKLREEDEERMFSLRRKYMEMLALKPRQNGLDTQTKLKELLARRQQLLEEQSVAQRAEMLERVVGEYRREVEASRKFHEKLEDQRKREYAARLLAVEQNRAAQVKLERMLRTAKPAASANAAGGGGDELSDSKRLSSSGERLRVKVLSDPAATEQKEEDPFAIQAFDPQSRSTADFPGATAGLRMHSVVTAAMGRRRSSSQGRSGPRASIVTAESLKGSCLFKRQPKEEDGTGGSSASPEVVAMWVRRRSSVHTPELPTFIQDHAEEPRFHTPLDATIRLRAVHHRPIPAADVPTAARKGFSATWNPAQRAASADRPELRLQLRVHEDWARRKQQLSPPPPQRSAVTTDLGGALDVSFSTPATSSATKQSMSLDDVLGRTKPQISISPPVGNAACPLVPVPRLEPSRAVIDGQYEEPFVVLSRDTVRQLAKTREIAAKKLQQERIASGCKAHASFGSKETQRRAAEAIAATLARMSQLSPPLK